MDLLLENEATTWTSGVLFGVSYRSFDVLCLQ